MPNKIVTTPDGLQICLVPRDQLRVKTAAVRFAIPYHLKELLASIPPASAAALDGVALHVPIAYRAVHCLG